MKRGSLSRAASLASLALLSGIASARADSRIYPDTGNAYSEAVDVHFPGVLPLRVVRVYNSHANHKGLLGQGWSFEFETELHVAADGTVVIQELGGGGRNRFHPVAGRGADPSKLVDELVNAWKRSGGATGTSSVEEYRARLKGSPEFREAEAERLTRRGFFPKAVLAKGTQLISERFGYEFVTKIDGGYQRRRSDSLWEKFDDAGRLRKVWDDRQNFIEYDYNQQGLPISMHDALGRKVSFEYSNGTKITKILAPYRQVVEYGYNPSGELASVTAIDGTQTSYKYDPDHRNLLTEAKYPFGHYEKFTYTPLTATPPEAIRTFRDGDGWTTTIDYGPDTYTKTVRDAHGDVRSTEKVQEVWASRPSGDRWLSKTIVTSGDEVTETTFNECCGAPVTVKVGAQQLTYEYDSRARLTRRTAPDQTEEWVFDPKTNQLLKHVVRPATGAPARETQYFYDAGGELLGLSFGDQQKFWFAVDNLGRIRTLTDPQKRKFMIHYAEASVPIDIADSAGHKAHIIYADAIKPFGIQIDNKEAMEMVSLLTDELEKLREILPAGRFNYPELLDQLRDLRSALVMKNKASN